ARSPRKGKYKHLALLDERIWNRWQEMQLGPREHFALGYAIRYPGDSSRNQLDYSAVLYVCWMGDCTLEEAAASVGVVRELLGLAPERLLPSGVLPATKGPSSFEAMILKSTWPAVSPWPCGESPGEHLLCLSTHIRKPLKEVWEELSRTCDRFCISLG